jgi:hypothetical protein
MSEPSTDDIKSVIQSLYDILVSLFCLIEVFNENLYELEESSILGFVS